MKNWFAHKPKINVLKVQTEIRSVTVKEESSYHSSYISSKSHEKSTKSEKVNFTIVLFVKDGELYTREFNGKWDLEDVKKWEEA